MNELNKIAQALTNITLVLLGIEFVLLLILFKL